MNSGMLEVRAGKLAYQHIKANGLSPDDIKAVFGASGAAKWLAIAGLDSAIFGGWLVNAQRPIGLFGTSIGAIKLAAAVQKDTKTRIKALGDAYIEQRYEGRPDADEIKRQGEVILDAALGETGIDDLINNSNYQFHCGAVACNGSLAAHNQSAQARGMSYLALQNLLGKQAMSRHLKRVIFSAPKKTGSGVGICSSDRVDSIYVSLDKNNLRDAIRASGSIPFYMHGVDWSLDKTDGEQTQVFRDGGLLDYHPSPSNFEINQSGLVLYPHFFDRIVETWFDKFLPWRQLPASRHEDTILLYPGEGYTRRLEMGRIPDRADFNRYAGKDEVRMRLWREALNLSYEIGEEWMELIRSQNWDRVKPL